MASASWMLLAMGFSHRTLIEEIKNYFLLAESHV